MTSSKNDKEWELRTNHSSFLQLSQIIQSYPNLQTSSRLGASNQNGITNLQVITQYLIGQMLYQGKFFFQHQMGYGLFSFLAFEESQRLF